MCCTPTARLLIVLTLPPRYRCPLNGTGLSALAPAQRAIAQRFSALALKRSKCSLPACPQSRVNRKRDYAVWTAGFDPERTLTHAKKMMVQTRSDPSAKLK